MLRSPGKEFDPFAARPKLMSSPIRDRAGRGTAGMGKSVSSFSKQMRSPAPAIPSPATPAAHSPSEPSTEASLRGRGSRRLSSSRKAVRHSPITSRGGGSPVSPMRSSSPARVRVAGRRSSSSGLSSSSSPLRVPAKKQEQQPHAGQGRRVATTPGREKDEGDEGLERPEEVVLSRSLRAMQLESVMAQVGQVKSMIGALPLRSSPARRRRGSCSSQASRSRSPATAATSCSAGVPELDDSAEAPGSSSDVHRDPDSGKHGEELNKHRKTGVGNKDIRTLQDAAGESSFSSTYQTDRGAGASLAGPSSLALADNEAQIPPTVDPFAVSSKVSRSPQGISKAATSRRASPPACEGMEAASQADSCIRESTTTKDPVGASAAASLWPLPKPAGFSFNAIMGLGSLAQPRKKDQRKPTSPLGTRGQPKVAASLGKAPPAPSAAPAVSTAEPARPPVAPASRATRPAVPEGSAPITSDAPGAPQLVRHNSANLLKAFTRSFQSVNPRPAAGTAPAPTPTVVPPASLSQVTLSSDAPVNETQLNEPTGTAEAGSAATIIGEADIHDKDTCEAKTSEAPVREAVPGEAAASDKDTSDAVPSDKAMREPVGEAIPDEAVPGDKGSSDAAVSGKLASELVVLTSGSAIGEAATPRALNRKEGDKETAFMCREKLSHTPPERAVCEPKLLASGDTPAAQAETETNARISQPECELRPDASLAAVQGSAASEASEALGTSAERDAEGEAIKSASLTLDSAEGTQGPPATQLHDNSDADAADTDADADAPPVPRRLLLGELLDASWQPSPGNSAERRPKTTSEEQVADLLQQVDELQKENAAELAMREAIEQTLKTERKGLELEVEQERQKLSQLEEDRDALCARLGLRELLLLDARHESADAACKMHEMGMMESQVSLQLLNSEACRRKLLDNTSKVATAGSRMMVELSRRTQGLQGQLEASAQRGKELAENEKALKGGLQASNKERQELLAKLAELEAETQLGKTLADDLRAAKAAEVAERERVERQLRDEREQGMKEAAEEAKAAAVEAKLAVEQIRRVALAVQATPASGKKVLARTARILRGAETAASIAAQAADKVSSSAAKAPIERSSRQSKQRGNKKGPQRAVKRQASSSTVNSDASDADGNCEAEVKPASKRAAAGSRRRRAAKATVDSDAETDPDVPAATSDVGPLSEPKSATVQPFEAMVTSDALDCGSTESAVKPRKLQAEVEVEGGDGGSVVKPRCKAGARRRAVLHSDCESEGEESEHAEPKPAVSGRVKGKAKAAAKRRPKRRRAIAAEEVEEESAKEEEAAEEPGPAKSKQKGKGKFRKKITAEEKEEAEEEEKEEKLQQKGTGKSRKKMAAKEKEEAAEEEEEEEKVEKAKEKGKEKSRKKMTVKEKKEEEAAAGVKGKRSINIAAAAGTRKSMRKAQAHQHDADDGKESDGGAGADVAVDVDVDVNAVVDEHTGVNAEVDAGAETEVEDAAEPQVDTDVESSTEGGAVLPDVAVAVAASKTRSSKEAETEGSKGGRKSRKGRAGATLTVSSPAVESPKMNTAPRVVSPRAKDLAEEEDHEPPQKKQTQTQPSPLQSQPLQQQLQQQQPSLQHESPGRENATPNKPPDEVNGVKQPPSSSQDSGLKRKVTSSSLSAQAGVLAQRHNKMLRKMSSKSLLGGLGGNKKALINPKKGAFKIPKLKSSQD